MITFLFHLRNAMTRPLEHNLAAVWYPDLQHEGIASWTSSKIRRAFSLLLTPMRLLAVRGTSCGRDRAARAATVTRRSSRRFRRSSKRPTSSHSSDAPAGCSRNSLASSHRSVHLALPHVLTELPLTIFVLCAAAKLAATAGASQQPGAGHGHGDDRLELPACGGRCPPPGASI